MSHKSKMVGAANEPLEFEDFERPRAYGRKPEPKSAKRRKRRPKGPFRAPDRRLRPQT